MIGQRYLKKTSFLGDYRITPWDMRFYALFKGEEMICVTVYKRGAVALMNRLYSMEAPCSSTP